MKSKGISRADANRAIRREALLEQLEHKGLIQKVIESADELSNFDIEMDAVKVSRIRAANEARLALIKKYLPDAKADQNINVGGQEDNPVSVGWTILPVRPVNAADTDSGEATTAGDKEKANKDSGGRSRRVKVDSVR